MSNFLQRVVFVGRVLNRRNGCVDCAAVARAAREGLTCSRERQGTTVSVARIIILACLMLFAVSPTWSQEHSHHQHEGMSMSADVPTESMLLSWKRESEGNHHLIGLLVGLSGIFILAQGILTKRFPSLAYAWPACFFLSGLFVLVYSDTELWPFGPKPWIQGTITNPEVIQHKLFAVLLLAVGLIETLRVRKSLKSVWLGLVFPVLALAGSVLLLFHSHSTGMRGPNHMAIMARIEAEHLSYSVTGMGIGFAKGLAEIATKWQMVFARLWPILMVVLGVLLMNYVE
jgi:copper resistance protein D